MIALALVLLLQAQGQELVGPPRPPVYRWKDRAGQSHVTTTVPPSNATIIEILTHENAVKEADIEDAAIPITPEEFRNQIESALGEKTIDYWHGIDKSFYDARQSKDADESIGTVDIVIKEALWGNRLWAISLLPLVIITICLLLAWWMCVGLSKPIKTLIWIAFGLVGLLLSHVCLNGLLYRVQAKRMDFVLSVMPHYLGGYVELSPDNQQAIRLHVEALSKTASPLSPPWAFSVEIHRVRQTLQRVVLESEP